MLSRRTLLRCGAAVAGASLARPRPAAAHRDDPDPARLVDPFIGTGGHGHTFPGAVVPFGMVALSPDNGVNGWDWCSGYHWSSDVIAGFSHTHLSGTGIGDLCDVLVTPLLSDEPMPRAAPARFRHADERAEPGYYAVRLAGSGILAELTATERVGVHRYTFPAGAAAALVVDLGFAVNWDRTTETAIALLGPSSLGAGPAGLVRAGVLASLRRARHGRRRRRCCRVRRHRRAARAGVPAVRAVRRAARRPRRAVRGGCGRGARQPARGGPGLRLR